jgi:hypothetical protein
MKAEDEKHAADDLEDRGEAEEREKLRPETEVGKGEKLAGAVRHEEERGDDAKHGERLRRPSVEAGQIR